MFRHKLDATYQIKLDSSTSLKISVDGTAKNNKTRNNYLARGMRGNDVLLNQNNRSLTNDADGRIFNASAFLTKKFKKKGRTFSLNIRQSFNQNDAKGFLNSQISYFDQQGAPDSVQHIDQYKTNNIKSSVLSTNLTYSEPLIKNFSVIFNYGLGLNNSSADRKSFNQSTEGRYDLLDQSLSNDYTLDQFSNQGGAVFNYNNNNKTIINFGTKVADVRFQQVDEYTGIAYKRNFTNWLPQAATSINFLNRNL